MVVVALALVIYVLPAPDVTLNFVRALAWPSVVAGTLYWLREPLRVKVAQLERFSAAGAQAEFLAGAATARLEDSIAGTAAAVIEPDEPLDTTSQEPADGDAPEVNPEVARGRRDQQVRLLRERAAVEALVRDSAKWGFSLARAGVSDLPEPEITWGADGRPAVRLNAPRRPTTVERLWAKHVLPLELQLEGVEERITDLAPKYRAATGAESKTMGRELDALIRQRNELRNQILHRERDAEGQ